MLAGCVPIGQKPDLNKTGHYQEAAGWVIAPSVISVALGGAPGSPMKALTSQVIKDSFLTGRPGSLVYPKNALKDGL